MRASMPNFPCDFEIPDEWWIAAGMREFAPDRPSYLSTAGARLVALREIEPPHCDHVRDWCGFDRNRMLRILDGMRTGAEMRPVPLLELLVDDVPTGKGYTYRALDGYHRFYASIAVGYQFLPASVIR